MYGMNFIFGNNFGFGCFCRPMINPFMTGAMNGYASASYAYAMMGGIPYTPSLFQFNMMPQSQGYSMMPTGNLFGFNAESVFGIPSYQQLQEQYNNFVKSKESNISDVSELLEEPELETSRYAEIYGKKSAAEKNDDSDKSEKTTSEEENVNPAEVKSNMSFKEKVESVAKSLNCKSEDLLAVMNSESGLKANAINKSGQGAVGLLQFTTPAIKELNKHGIKITKEELLKMDAVKQMDYVEKYLKIAKSYSFAKDAKLTAGDLYALTFLPGRASREVLTKNGENFYSCNRPLDINNDGQITKSDLEARMNRFRVSLVA